MKRIFIFLLASLLLVQGVPVQTYAEEVQQLTLRQVLAYLSQVEGVDFISNWRDYTGASKSGVDAPYFLVFKRFNGLDVSTASYDYHIWTYDAPATLTSFSATQPRMLKVVGTGSGCYSTCFSMSVPGRFGASLGIIDSRIDCRSYTKGELIYTNLAIDPAMSYDPEFIRLTPDDDLLGYYAPATPSPAPTATPSPSPSPAVSPAVSATPTPEPTITPTPEPTATPTPKPTATPMPPFPTRQPTSTPTPLPLLPTEPDVEGGESTATGCALCVNVLLEINAKLDTAIWHLECIAALLLILVVFGTLRIVSRWSKGVSLR